MIYSEIEWIGSVPEDWNMNRLGQLFDLRNVKVSDKIYSPLSVSKGGVVPQLESVAKSDASEDRKLVLAGDFVINSRSDRKQSCGVSNLDGSVSLINIVMFPKNNKILYTNYLNFLLKNYGFAEEFYKWGHGIVADLWTTRWQEMKNIILPMPPYESQIRIYNHLSFKIEIINLLIELERKQIDKINGYKNSLITEAINHELIIEDNIVDWDNIKIKYAYKTRNEKYESGVFQYIAIENVESYSGKYVETETNSNYSLSGTILAEKNDVIFGKLRPYLAKSLIVNKKCCVSSEFAVFYSNINSTRFLKYVFLSNRFIDIINSSTYGTKMPRANIDFIKDLEIKLPSLQVQNIVADFLDEKCQVLDRVINIKNKKIDSLIEYKKSLIYEFVTGKKEVI